MYQAAGACAPRVHPRGDPPPRSQPAAHLFSALIDRTVTPDELRHELLSLIHGWPATVHQDERPERPRVMALTQHAGPPTDNGMTTGSVGHGQSVSGTN
jgi:hypothetical protein